MNKILIDFFNRTKVVFITRKISLAMLLFSGIGFFSVNNQLTQSLYAQNIKKSGLTADLLRTYNKGLENQQNENFYLASQNYLEVVEMNPAFSDAWLKLAECSYKLGEFDLALRYLESAELYEKENWVIQNLKGMIFLSMGKIDEGKAIFNEILKKYPNNIDAHFGLAEIELYEGRFSGAELQYNEALKRQNTNRKALLSLALICAERGRYEQAEVFMRQVLESYSGDSEVHYLAAIINIMKKDYVTAEKHTRIAVEINGDYEKAYNLLSNILYQQGRFGEVIDVCDFLIGRNRNNSNAWYIKGIALSKIGQNKEAINVWSTGLSINPQDEVMRFLMEMEIRENLSLEDSRRNIWAKYHIENAKLYETRYDALGSVYEYQRALMLDPMNYSARIAYANLLEINGMHELYLEQLKFIKENSSASLSAKQSQDLTDKIEAFDSLLEKTLAKDWKIDAFYLDKIRWNIAVFYEDNTSSFIHADANRVVAKAAADIFSGVAITSVKTQVTPVSGYGEAFANARSGNYDYFILLSLSEGQNDLTLASTIYSGRTGLEVDKNSFYATGNNRFSTVLRRFRTSVLEELPVRGKILARNGKTVLVDLGKSEKIQNDAVFKIVKKGSIRTADFGTGLYCKDSDVLGTLKITRTGEEVSEAIIEEHGFYDKINIDDEVVLVSMPNNGNNGSNNAGNPIDTVPGADERGNRALAVDNAGESGQGALIVDEIKNAIERPFILELLRNIY